MQVAVLPSLGTADPQVATAIGLCISCSCNASRRAGWDGGRRRESQQRIGSNTGNFIAEVGALPAAALSSWVDGVLAELGAGR